MSNSSDNGQMIDNHITANTPSIRRALRAIPFPPPPLGRLRSPFATAAEAAAAAALEDNNGKKLK